MLVTNNVGKDVWLKSFSKKTVEVYGIGYEKFIQFMNETEEGNWDDTRLLKEREVDLKERNFAFEQKMVEFYRWLDRLPKKLSDNSRKTYVASVCSFFAFHRLDLKFTKAQGNLLYKRAKPKRKYYNFALEDIKKMSEVASAKERYVLLVGKSLGLRAGDFIRLKQGTFEAHLKGEAPISLGELYTEKEGVRASPFLDEDAIEASKILLQILESKGRRNPEARMVDISHQEVDLIVKKLAKRAGIDIGNEVVRFHALRVFLATRLSSVTSESRWKQILGKTISEGAYVKPFQLRDDYAKVMPLTTVRERVAQEKVVKLTEELETVKKRESLARDEMDLLRERMKVLEAHVEDLRKTMESLERKQYYTLLEAFGAKIVSGKEAEQTVESIEQTIEESEE